MNYVYALVDPKTYEPFYIGRTNNPQLRMDSHIRNGHGNDALYKHILTIINDGLCPVMDILYECHDESEANDVEQQVIFEYRQEFTLLNLQIKKSDVAVLRRSKSQVSMCGDSGYYCKRTKGCSICHEVERGYREQMVVDMLHDDDYVFYLCVDNSEIAQIKKQIASSGYSYLIVPQKKNTSLIISDVDFYTNSRDSIEISADVAVSILILEENLFPSGKRSARGRWRFNTWRKDFANW